MRLQPLCGHSCGVGLRLFALPRTVVPTLASTVLCESLVSCARAFVLFQVEHVEGFMLTAFAEPADAVLWGLRLQELMLREDWCVGRVVLPQQLGAT
jgi:hypothetical protein